MLNQGIIQIGESRAFIDQHSDKCHDGKPCDDQGETIFEVDGIRYTETSWWRSKNYPEYYMKFTSEYRWQIIIEDMQKWGQRMTMQSCSCSKCGTVSFDEAFWTCW